MALGFLNLQIEAVNKQLTQQIVLQAKMLDQMKKSTKGVVEQKDAIEKTSKSVKDMVHNFYSLNDAQDAVTNTTDTFARRFAKAANGVDGMGKSWTMFSRILSGSPLWKLQNYVRSVGQMMDFMATKTEEATKAANEQAKAIGTLTVNIEQVEEQLNLMSKAGNHKELIESNLEYKNTFEALRAAGMTQKKAEQTALARTQNMYKSTLSQLKENLKQEGKALMKATKNEQFIKTKARLKELKSSKDAEDIKRLQALKSFKKMRKDMEKLKKARDKIQKKFGPMGPEIVEANKAIASQKGKMGAFSKKEGGGELAGLADAQKKMFDRLLVVRLAKFGKDFMTLKPIFSAISGTRKLIKKNGGFLKSIGKVAGIATKVFKMAMLYSMYFILFLVGALLAFVFIKKIFEKAEVLSVIMETLSGVFEGLKEMFGGAILIFEAFFGGGTLKERFEKLFKGILGLYKGLGKIIFSVLKGAVKLAVNLIVAYFTMMIEIYLAIIDKVTDPKFWKDTVLGFIKRIPEFLGMAVTAMFNKIKDFWGTIKEYFTGKINSLKNALSPSKRLKGLGSKIKGFVGLQTGGIARGGMTMVGERGPELINLPKGTSVHSNDTTKTMMGGHVTNNISVNVNGRLGASDTELRDIAKKIGRMVSTEINRTTSSSTNVRF